MKYWISIRGSTLEVEVLRDGSLLVDGKPVQAAIAGETGWLFSVEVNGQRHPVAVERDEGRWVVTHAGQTATVEVETERSRRLEAARKSGARGRGNGVVKAPMPGLVLRLDVEAGARVEAGAGLLVLEAMKMENLIRAPVSGVVTRIDVSQGQAVEKGALLVQISDDVS